MQEPELQTGTVDRAQPAGGMTPATAANSTTLAKLEADRKRANLVIGILTTAGTTAMVVPFPPWSFIASAALYIGAVAVAYFTNTMSPEKLEALVAKAGEAASAAASSAKKPTGGAP
jgi:hypothetical protein